jgi:DNA primase
VGREGRAAFEQRLAGAKPLSEYLMSHLAEQVDMSHADGQARYVSLLRPLLEKLTPGVFRELLIERIAAQIGLHADRLRSLLSDLAAETPAPPRLSEASAARPAAIRRVGRGGLVTQAIQTLLHFPAAARALPESLVKSLDHSDQPGVPVLRELLTELRTMPGTSTAAVLERWRERAESRRLAELARAEMLVEDADAAARELVDTLQRLTDTDVRRARLDELIAQARGGTLSAEQMKEYQSLISALGTDARTHKS